MRRSATALIVSLVAWGTPAASAAKPEALAVSLETIDDAITHGVGYLIEKQRPDGTWGTGDKALSHTALVVLTLLHSGVREDQQGPHAKRLRKALGYLDRHGPGRAKKRDEDPGTYTTSLLLLLLRDRGRGVDRDRMQRLADLLVRTQADNGQWWYYGRPGKRAERGPETGDNSNTQFAVLALCAAVGSGLDVSEQALARARKWWRTTVHDQGGFGYASGGSPHSQPSGSMTAAGIACLAALDAALYGLGADEPHIASRKALAWMVDNYSVTKNEGPAQGRARERQRNAGRGWLHYYLWTIERAMVLSQNERLGDHDWYREGAEQLLQSQHKDGSWRAEHPLYATSFALLFLTRAADPPRAFTKPGAGTPVPQGPDRPVTGPDDEPPDVAPADPPPSPAEVAPEGTLEDWLDEDTLPPGELARRCRLRGKETLRPLVAFLNDPDRGKRQVSFEALVELLPEERVYRADRHPLARGRLDLWLRKNLAVLTLEGDRFVVP